MATVGDNAGSTETRADGICYVSGIPWRVGKRYKDLEFLCMGSNGVICHAVDTQTSQRVVISKRDGIYTKMYLQRNVRDLQIMQRLQEVMDDVPVPHIVDIMCYPRANSNVSEIYVVLEAKEANLEQIIQQSDNLPSESQTKLIMYQLIRALNLIHSAGLIHRCIRPNHLLLNSECELEICDFKLAALQGVESDPNFELLRFTDSYRVEHLHYWAPEVLINEEVTVAVDIWSAGCIFGELLTGKRLFDSSDVRRQLDLIFGILGSPTLDDLSFIRGDASRTALKAIKPSKITIEDHFVGVDPQALDLIRKMLVFSPQKRITAKDALEHPYFSEYHDPSDEPLYPNKDQMIKELEASDASVEKLREVLVKELQKIQLSISMIGEIPVVNGHQWHVGNRYDSLEFLTRGSNGTYCSAIDKQTGDKVAISKRDGLYSQEYCLRNARDILIIKKLQKLFPEDYELIPCIRDIVYRPASVSASNPAELYVVQTFMEANLEDIMKSQRLTPDQVWFIMYSLLVVLKLIHSAGIVHRCIRPRHVLLSSELSLSICDFRRAIICNEKGCQEEYKWAGTATEGSWRYLAPEALCYEEQNTACDMWSAGCVFGEMLLGRPLFPSDANAANIFRMIFSLLGQPSDADLAFVKSELGMSVLRQLKYDRSNNLDELLAQRNVSKDASDLLKKMLVFNPTKRITAEKALEHPYFSKLHIPEEEPTYNEGRRLSEEMNALNLPTSKILDKIVQISQTL